jgi:hypothetical protein
LKDRRSRATFIRSLAARSARFANVAQLALAALATTWAGCGRAEPAPVDGAHGEVKEASGDVLASLRAFESARRAAADFARAPASDRVMGADPYAVRAVPDRDTFVGVLRGEDALVVLDRALTEIARLPAPESPVGLAVAGRSGDVLVSSELRPVIARYMWRRGALERAGDIVLKGVQSIRDVATGPEGAIYAVDEHEGRLITLLPRGPKEPARDAKSIDVPAPTEASAAPFERVDTPACAGPIRVARAGDFVIVNCLLDRTILVRRVDSRGVPLHEGEARIQHDGPLWCFDAAPLSTPARKTGGLLVAAGGVEDHPLDRREGSFGYIDSFVFLYEVTPGSEKPVTRLAEVNVSELKVITPKAIKLELGAEETAVRVTGYGGPAQARLVWRGNTQGGVAFQARAPEISVSDLPPGTTSMAEGGAGDGGALVLASPLLDAWVSFQGGNSKVVPAGAKRMDRPEDKDARSRRLGEALFFTSLMAPWNGTEGRLSRFTCETCHFEGYVDGRTHHTGRGDIRATTKPLLGLFNNRPHFSRALDPDLTAVAHNEFRVAGAKSGHDPWFSIEPRDFPWLAPMGAAEEGGAAIGPEALREALMLFLMDFTHRPNPAVVGRTTLSSIERRGAEIFRDTCEGCHSARLSADEPGSAVPFEGWERLIMAREGAIVWARSEYKKTGITPYVHDQGARVPSLRRLYKKRPYFTNGSAKTLDEVLERARALRGGADFYHDGAPDGAEATKLDEEAREALRAFLNLL